MDQFSSALRKQAITWYMKYIENMLNATKAQIRQQFMSLFNNLDAKHLEAKKLKTTVQKLMEIIREYDKKFKYLLI